jgi:Domain of unknown function (DUF1883)
MQYQSYDCGQLNIGEVIEVTLMGNSANVKLMDSSNFSNYRSGRPHRYFGGHVKLSPYKIAIPHSGKWHVTIDLGGYAGSVNSSVRVLP